MRHLALRYHLRYSETCSLVGKIFGTSEVRPEVLVNALTGSLVGNVRLSDYTGVCKLPRESCPGLLQLRVLALCFFQDRDVGVGVFPEREENFVGGEPRTRAAAASALCEVLDSKALARATPRCANAPVQQFHTMPLWSRTVWNSAAASFPCPDTKYVSPRM
jgi:hypothetical protein